MFQRRNPLPLLHRARELVWPKSGWRRASLYVAHRLSRLPGTPYRIAAGFACGAAVSFTPFMGFHFVGAALLALVVRGNLIASAIGTVVGNPWTFPFIWLWSYHLGRWLLGGSAGPGVPEELSMTYIFENFSSVFWPMTVGGLPTAMVAWFAFFWPAHVVVSQYQRRRRRRLRRKVARMRRHDHGVVAPAGRKAEIEG